MAYSRSDQSKELEKRLRIVQQQLYGKEAIKKLSSEKESTSHTSYKIISSKTAINVYTKHQDLTYLKKDLLKIIVLGGIILIGQALLYIGMIRGVINI